MLSHKYFLQNAQHWRREGIFGLARVELFNQQIILLHFHDTNGKEGASLLA